MRAAARLEVGEPRQGGITRVELNAGRSGLSVELGVEPQPAFGVGDVGFRHMSTKEVEAWQHAQG
jgi:hypothetical protein